MGEPKIKWECNTRRLNPRLIGGRNRLWTLIRCLWPSGGGLRVPDNITLLSLPPYAPELNPMENVWEYLRANTLCAVVWDTYDTIVEAYRKAWQFLTDDPDRIQSIGTHEWASVSG